MTLCFAASATYTSLLSVAQTLAKSGDEDAVNKVGTLRDYRATRAELGRPWLPH